MITNQWNKQINFIEDSWNTYICKSNIWYALDSNHWSILLVTTNNEIKYPIDTNTWLPTDYEIFNPTLALTYEYSYWLIK